MGCTTTKSKKMTQLRYIGNQKPTGMIIEVDEDRVKAIMKSGEFERLDIVEKPIEKKVVKSNGKYRK